MMIFDLVVFALDFDLLFKYCSCVHSLGTLYIHTKVPTYAVCTMYILDRHTYKSEKMVHAQYYILYKSSQVCKMCLCTTFFRENDYSTAIGFAVCAWLAKVLGRRRHAGGAAVRMVAPPPRSLLTHLPPRRSHWRTHVGPYSWNSVLKNESYKANVHLLLKLWKTKKVQNVCWDAHTCRFLRQAAHSNSKKDRYFWSLPSNLWPFLICQGLVI